MAVESQAGSCPDKVCQGPDVSQPPGPGHLKYLEVIVVAVVVLHSHGTKVLQGSELLGRQS